MNFSCFWPDASWVLSDDLWGDLVGDLDGDLEGDFYGDLCSSFCGDGWGSSFCGIVSSISSSSLSRSSLIDVFGGTGYGYSSTMAKSKRSIFSTTSCFDGESLISFEARFSSSSSLLFSESDDWLLECWTSL